MHHLPRSVESSFQQFRTSSTITQACCQNSGVSGIPRAHVFYDVDEVLHPIGHPVQKVKRVYQIQNYLPSNIFLIASVEYCDASVRERDTNPADLVMTYRLGSLEGHTECSVPDELRDNTKGSRDTKEDSVEVLLVETVAKVLVLRFVSAWKNRCGDVLGEEDTRVGINIWPRV